MAKSSSIILAALAIVLLLYTLVSERTPLVTPALRVAVTAPRAPHGQAPPSVPASLDLFTFPPFIRRVIVNVGANRNPPQPLDEETAVIAVEPVLQTAMQIPKHPRVFVIVAAISNVSGFAPIYTYNGFGESSTLANADNTGAYWTDAKYRDEGYPPVSFVPVLTMEQLLRAVPPHITIALLQTDMQGYDFLAASSCPLAVLRRAEQIFHEANCNGFVGMNPNAPRNDFDGEWMGFMEKKAGYLLTLNECATLGNGREGNALWTRDDVAAPQRCGSARRTQCPNGACGCDVWWWHPPE
jgi:hypothetical protein